MGAGTAQAPKSPRRAAPECFLLRPGRGAVRLPAAGAGEEAGGEMAYWARALEVMAQTLEPRDLTFYLVWDGADGLPSRAPDAVVVGVKPGSWPAVSRWTGQVAIAFQAGGRRPRLHGAPSSAGFVPSMTAKILRARQTTREVASATGRLTRRRSAPRRPARVFDVPLGYHSRPSAEPLPILQRPIDLSFAGSVSHWQGRWGRLQERLGAPKVRCRREMLKAVSRLRRNHPDLAVSTRVTGSFAESSPFHGSRSDGHSDEYWRLLSETKLCLVPGGTYEYTYRHFEAMRSGCVIVTDTRPSGAYMHGAGMIALSGWDDLERAVLSVLDDDAELERLGRASLECWRRHCSEEAVGRFLADRLNELPRTRGRSAGYG